MVMIVNSDLWRQPEEVMRSPLTAAMLVCTVCSQRQNGEEAQTNCNEEMEAAVPAVALPIR